MHTRTHHVSKAFGRTDRMISTIATLKEVDGFLPPVEGTLLILDVDETLVRTPSHQGSEAWYEERFAAHLGRGVTRREAILAANDEWEGTQRGERMRPSEPETVDLVAKWQSLPGLKVMGLTARRPEFAGETFRQLHELGIRLETSPPLTRTKRFASGAHYEQGILFVGPVDSKGDFLRDLVRELPTKPLRLVAVDDREYQIASLDECGPLLGVECVALWYRRA